MMGFVWAEFWTEPGHEAWGAAVSATCLRIYNLGFCDVVWLPETTDFLSIVRFLSTARDIYLD